MSFFLFQNPSIVVDRSFDVPESVLEDSVNDNSVLVVEPDHHHTKEYYIVKQGSNRGKMKLVDTGGYSYTVSLFRLIDYCI